MHAAQWQALIEQTAQASLHCPACGATTDEVTPNKFL